MRTNGFITRRTRLVATSASLVSIAALSVPTAAQTPSSTFVPGTRDIFVMDFHNLGPGGLPTGVTVRSQYSTDYKDGAPDLVSVVTKDGAPMLKAVKPVDLKIQLPEALPDAFTLEFDIIPKASGGPADLAFEGTPNVGRSSASMHVEWQTEVVRAYGGCDGCDKQITNPLKDVVQAQPTTIQASFQGTTFQLFTNGQPLFDQPLDKRNFVHGRILRVSLGGQDDNMYAVHLSKVRIAAGGGVAAVATQSGGGSNSSSTSSSGGSASTTTTVKTDQPQPGFAVTVTLGSAGPLVSWNPVPGATAYTVQRKKVDDATCCNNATGQAVAATSWQDTPLPMSGTYDYQVVATTPAGQILGETQFGYRQPSSGTTATTPTTVTAVPATSTGSITPITSSGTGTPTSGTVVSGSGAVSSGPRTVSTMTSGTSGSGTASSGTSSSASSGPGGSPTGCASSPSAPNTMTSTSTAGSTACPPLYRVTLTGFRVFKTTLEPPLSPDGRYDEAYAAAVMVLWNRKTSTVVNRSSAKTLEYGDIGNGTIFKDRIKAGTAPPAGGLWTGNGSDQVPAEFDPTGANIPDATSDRFPLLLWEGTLNQGVEALVVVPTLWDRDIDSSPYAVWSLNWTTAPVNTFFASPMVQNAIAAPALLPNTPDITVGVPYAIAPQDALAHIKDRPIGLVPEPIILPVVLRYHDQNVIITQEKLTSLTPGTSTTIAIPFTEQPSAVTGASYTLYLRIQRTQ